jgi:hypothetical protein
LDLRRTNPVWGGRKIRRVLQRDVEAGSVVPAASTITGILRRGGLLERETPVPEPFRRFEADAPNLLWQMDFKGHFALARMGSRGRTDGKGERCFPLTVLDDHSRYLLGAQACRDECEATVRFETTPGRQLQIDFGERLVEIAGRKVKVFLFVATLGYSRRLHVRAFHHERQESWFDGMESSFLAFGGVPEEVLLDNARALVIEHDAESRTVVFNAKLLAFARHWGFRPRACAPYRARTKGKTERGVGYVKRNAIAGRSFASWEAFEAGVPMRS